MKQRFIRGLNANGDLFGIEFDTSHHDHNVGLCGRVLISTAVKPGVEAIYPKNQFENYLLLLLPMDNSFLSGVASGVLCVIVNRSCTFVTHKILTAIVSLLSFIIIYFMTIITMAVPRLVCAYYVCFAENSTTPFLIKSNIF
jgi:hypothetical protein